MVTPQKTSRVSGAYLQLKDEIRHNRMPPGFQAPEPEIALRLGMSRTPVREALIRLESEGLVELIPRRGARVLPISPSDMKEIYEVLTALEPSAAANLAGRKPSIAELEPLAKATQDMEDALSQNDHDTWAEADDRFHNDLLQLHGNRRLKDIVSALHDQVYRARIVTLRLRALPVQSTLDHRTILTHLSEGEAEEARVSFRMHRERAAEELLEILENYKLNQL